MTALEAAQRVGGDIRGKQSAAMLVVRANATGKVWKDRVVDLRVEDHPEPLQELRRLLRVHRAYEHINRGDLAMEQGDVDGALEAYRAAEAVFLDNLEIKYWHAVSMANAGMVESALPLFQEIFGQDRNWLVLTGRLPEVGLLRVNAADMKAILGQAE